MASLRSWRPVPPEPQISVVVASHHRPLRLRWLLNALEEQTLPPASFEVVVGHDAGAETERVLSSHPLARAGLLRAVRSPTDSAPPGANRNVAWRVARAPLVATVDDDCRPAPDWLERLLAASAAHPGSLVQGRTIPDPDETARLRSPLQRSQDVTPPSGWGEACNMLYPRPLLERLGGFDDDMLTGEDCDLAMRALAVGVPVEAAHDALVHHAVHTPGLRTAARDAWRWRFMPRLVARHPRLRTEHLWLGVFWKRSHALLLVAAAGLVLTQRGRPLALLLALPWVRERLPTAQSPAGYVRAAGELPLRAAIDGLEVAALTAGSVRERTVVL
jgi:hypothetical protein